MTISSRILLFFVIVASIAFFYMATRTLKTHESWRGLKNRLDQNLQKVEDEIAANTYGKVEISQGQTNVVKKGIPQLRAELKALSNLSGSIWRNVVIVGFQNPAEITVRIPPRTAEPNSLPGLIGRGNSGQAGAGQAEGGQAGSGLYPLPLTTPPSDGGGEVKPLVYLFDEKPAAEGGRFFGVFRVESSALNQQDQSVDAKLVPMLNNTALGAQRRRELDRALRQVAQAQEPLVIYDTMLLAHPELFAGLNEDQLKELMPPTVDVQEFLRSGTDAKDDDPQSHIQVIDGRRVYQRPLVDYAQMLISLDEAKAAYLNKLQELGSDLTVLQRAVELASDNAAKRAEEVVDLKERQIPAIEREVQAARGVQQDLQGRLDAARAERESTFRRVKALNRKYTQNQLRLLQQSQQTAANTSPETNLSKIAFTDETITSNPLPERSSKAASAQQNSTRPHTAQRERPATR